MDKMDRWMTSWQSLASQKFERLQQQNSYDHDTISKRQKEIERLLLEGFDLCKTESLKSYSFRKESEKAVKDIFKSHNGDIIKVTKMYTDSQLSEDPATENPIPQSCENPKLVRKGESKVLRVGDSKQNEGSRDFNIRYCDQQTNGGGWTVR